MTYKWPSWLHKQTEKQRIIWAYKILFLDVLFPLGLEKACTLVVAVAALVAVAVAAVQGSYCLAADAAALPASPCPAHSPNPAARSPLSTPPPLLPCHRSSSATRTR
ncbi:hypothetical protein [Salmonella enterica]|uniref:hypothetical protein n=1 Tax=Salmonella enterica TaxID=28901 RepID=UPI003523176E